MGTKNSGTSKQNKECAMSLRNMVIEKIIRNIADLRMDKVCCCHFDEGNLHVTDDVTEDIKVTTGQ